MDIDQGKRLVAEAGFRVVKSQQVATNRRLEKALRRYTEVVDGASVIVLLDGATYDRVTHLPGAVAKALSGLLEFLAPLPGYTPIAECVDAAEALADLPEYRQEAAWAVLEEHPDQPLRAVRSVARAGGLTG
ncbi:MAG: hypothetical protein GY901_01565 [Actinomycetia bacterium]|nr:hypothetical protein [Actinomycetes bacterium]